LIQHLKEHGLLPQEDGGEIEQTLREAIYGNRLHRDSIKVDEKQYIAKCM